MDLKHLKSGSDIRGTALEGVEGQGVTLTDESVRAIADAFVVWISARCQKDNLKIALGHDSRLSAERILNILIESFKAAGCDIYICGLCSTPSMFMMTRYDETDCDASVMITASHHPYNKNGLKFFTKSGGLDGKDIAAIIQLAERGEKKFGHVTKTFKRDFMQIYCDTLIAKVRKDTGSDWPLTGFKIVVDAGNGAGGFFADRVLKPLGASTAGSQYLEPDGNFPNHIPNPEDKNAMQAISRCVKDNKADLGIIFDTDVDRAAVVGADGSEINRNRLIALISDILLSENPNISIVTDSVTSDGLTSFITMRGGKHHRFKRGYKNVIDEAVRLNKEGRNAPLAIETSGHAAFKENFFLDDGAYLVTRIIIKMAQLKNEGRSLESLISDLVVAKEEREIRLNFKTDDFLNYGNMLIAKLAECANRMDSVQLAPTNYEGIRANIDYAEGWFLARMSVHDPIMPINIESNKSGGVQLIAKFLYAFLSSFSEVDTSELKIIAGV